MCRDLEAPNPGATKPILWKYVKICLYKICIGHSFEDRKSQFCHAAAKKIVSREISSYACTTLHEEAYVSKCLSPELIFDICWRFIPSMRRYGTFSHHVGFITSNITSQIIYIWDTLWSKIIAYGSYKIQVRST